MEKALEILEELKNNSGNKLQEILKENYNNEMLKQILEFVYNPFFKTGMSKKKINKKVDLKLLKSEPKSILEVFSYLKSHPTGRDLDIAYVQLFINKNNNYEKILKDIFTKELKIGVTSKTINKVWKDLVPEFNVMLAEKYWERKEKLEQEKPDIIITQKLDGIRCVAMVDFDENVTLFSRQGKIIEGLKDIEKEAKTLTPGCYDGELLLDKENLSSKDLYRETVSVVNSKSEYKKNVTFNIFDSCSLFEFTQQKASDTNCYQRKKFVALQIYNNNNYKYLKYVPILYCGEYDSKVIEEELNKQIRLENEGIMVNILEAPYEFKRTKNILKVKAMDSVDLKIIGVEEGKGRNKGVLGSLIMDYKGYLLYVGSGFTDTQRKWLWNKRNDLIGKIAEIQYFEETKNKKTGSLSLRFPVFLRFRFDKNQESYY